MHEVVKGGLFLMASGAALAMLRQVPEKAWYWLRRQFLVTLDVADSDPVFEWLTLWLHEHEYTKKARALTAKSTDLSGLQDATTFDGRVLFSPAPGHHVMMYRKHLLWLWRDRPESKGGGGAAGAIAAALKKSETFNIRILSRDPAIIRQLVQDAMESADRIQQKRVNVYVSTWWAWKRLTSIRPRKLDSVVLPKGIAEDILADLTEFLASKDWYQSMGIPFHRGCLFHGVPGSGKSSLVMALAGELKLNLYVISLAGSGMSDEQLAQLITDVQPRSIILFEDVDAALKNRAADSEGAVIIEDDKKGVTLSGLLNVLDGVVSREEVVVIMTTNHKEKLDAALIRPGRVDKQVEFTYATEEQIARLYDRFDPDNGPGANDYVSDWNGRKVTMAEVQEHLLSNRAPSRMLPLRCYGTEINFSVEEIQSPYVDTAKDYRTDEETLALNRMARR